MKKFLLSFFMFLFTLVGLKAQTIIASDNFDNPANWTLNSAVGGVVNSSALTANTVSPNGLATEDNRWIINNVYSHSSYTCLGTNVSSGEVKEQPVELPNANGNYLHMIQHCAMQAGELSTSWHSSLTNKKKLFAAMNYDFNTIGYHSINFTFWAYHSQGISVYYSTNGGSTWNFVGELGLVNNWVRNSYINPGFDNKANLRFGFLWDDAIGSPNTYPAVDAIELSTLPLSCNFYSNKNTLCAAYEEVVTFTNMSAPSDPSVTYNWNISPGTAGIDWIFVESTNANSKNPKIKFITENIFTVKLTTTRAITSETLSIEKTIQVIDGCQCEASGGTEVLIDETGKYLNNWASQWILEQSGRGNWRSTPGSYFNAPNLPAAYMDVTWGDNNSWADIIWNEDLDFSNTNASYILTFDVSNQAELGGTYQNKIQLHVSTNSGASWTLFYTHASSVVNWTPQTVDLSSYAGNSNIRIKFRGIRSTGMLGGAYTSGIKDVVLTKESSSGGVGDDPIAKVEQISGNIPSCGNENLTFVCNITNIAPYAVTQYIWSVDGVEVQSGTSDTFSSTTLTDGQSVVCAVMLSDPSCPGPYASLPYIVFVIEEVTPNAWIKAVPNGYVCEGENMSFMAVYEHGGDSPSFQWLLNGNLVSIGTSYASSQLEDGDTLKLIMTSNANCLTVNPIDYTYIHHQYDTTIVSIDHDISLCELTEVNFSSIVPNGTAPFVYQWYVNGNSIGNDTVLNIDNLLAGDEVYLVVSSETTCSGQSNSLWIHNDTVPTSILTSPTFFCGNGNTYTFEASPKNGIWSGNGIIDTINGVFDPSIVALGTHTIKYTIIGPCGGSDIKHVVVVSPPNINIPDNIVACAGEEATIDVGIPAVGYFFEWSNGDTTQTIDVVSPGMYYVTVTDGYNCVSTDSVEVSFVDVSDPTITTTQLEFCTNESPIQFNAVDGGGIWSGDGIDPYGLFTPQDAGFGTHTITYTISGFCGGTDNVDIEVYLPPVIYLTPSVTVCEGDVAILDAGLAAIGCTYEWSNGDTTTITQVSIAGMYYLTVTNSYNCFVIDSIEAIFTPKPDPTITTTQLSFCVNGSSLQFEAADSGGIWIGTGINSTTGVFDPTIAGVGTHQIIYAILGYCGSNDTVFVTVHQVPYIYLGSDKNICSGDSIELDAGSGFVGYSWSTGETTQTIVVSSEDTYTVTVTDNNACSNSDSIFINVTPSSDPTIITAQLSYCINGGTIQFEAVDSGGIWLGTAINNTTGVFDPTKAGVGTHQISYTIIGKCGSSDTVLVTVHSAPFVYIGSDKDICSGDSIALDAGSGFVDYIWSTGETTQIIVVDKEGAYSVTVTDGNTCSGFASVYINEIPLPDPSITITEFDYCSNDSPVQFTATTTGGVWFGKGINTSTGMFNPATAGVGDHIITYTIIDKCGSTDTVMVTVHLAPIITLVSAICSADLTTYNVEFISNAGTISTSAGTLMGNTIIDVPVGTDVIITADNNSCLTSLTINSPDCSCPVIPLPTNSNNPSICEGSVIPDLTVEVPSGYIVNWFATSSGGIAIASGTSFTPTDTLPGVYTYYAESVDTATDCTSLRLPVTLTIVATPAVDILTDVTECDNYILPVLISGNYYLQSGGVEPINAGTSIDSTQTIWIYAETGTIPNCTNESSFIVSIVETPIITIVSKTCSPDITTYNVEFTVSTGDVSVSDGVIVGNTITDIPVDTDITIIADNNSCITTLIVNSPDCSCPVIPLPTNPNNPIICEGSVIPDLTVEVPSGYIVNWFATSSGGIAIASGTSFTPIDILPGIYTYYAESVDTATDCTSLRLPVTLTIIVTPKVDNLIDVVECGFYILPTLTNGNYYLQSGGIGNIPEGSTITSSQTIWIYAETGTNPNCTNESSFVVTINPVPVVNLLDDTHICNGDTLILEAGPGFASYQWSNGSISQAIEVTSAGAYSVTVSNQYLCTASDEINITVYDKADASILTSGPFCSNDEALQFEAVTSGGTWSGKGINSSGWFTPAFAQAGLHAIIHTIGGYCGDSDTVQVIVNEAPTYTIVKQDETCYPANDGVIQIVVSDPSYLIMWNIGSTSFELDNLHPGKYTFEIVDANNCKVSDNVIIDQSFDDCHPSHFYVPNIFSPNGDGENDQLCVRGHGITSLEFVVYNRWGNKVFETTTLDTCWDGKYQGAFAEAGVYAYVIKIVYKDKSRIEKHGTVTLVR